MNENVKDDAPQFDDAAQTIQGVHFDSRREYLAVRFAVENEYMSGFPSTHDDVLWLHHRYHQTDRYTLTLYKKIFGEKFGNSNISNLRDKGIKTI